MTVIPRPAAPPRFRRLAAALLVAAVTAAAGCDSITEPAGGLSGRWTSTDGRGALATGAPMTLELEQRGGEVTGTGRYVLGGETVPLAVEGTIDERVVVLTLAPPGSAPAILLQGMLADDRSRITAALTLGASTETRIFEREE